MKKFTKKQWIKFSIAAVLYTLFAIWMQNLWLLLGLIVLVDIFLTHYIPWGAWKRSKNPAVRNVLEWVDDIVFAGSRLFHQFVRLPELSDTEFFPREILAGRRLPVRQQIKLRPSRSEHSDLLPVGTKYVAYLKLQIVSGLAGMGLQTGERFGPRET
jgi:hypothetical protein